MTQKKLQYLIHPEMGQIAAIRIIDCIFGLMKNGRIVHFHIEQMEVTEEDAKICFNVTDKSPLEHRSRCQIIPPFVNAFDQ
jgi:hypothetical protein